MNWKPWWFSAVVKATLHHTAEAKNANMIKDKLYLTKINPVPEEKGAAY